MSSIPIPFRTLCWLCFCATVVVCCRCVLHRLCSTTCKHPCLKLGVSLFRHPCRKPLPPCERLCMLGWLCIVQSPCAYTPGIRAVAILLGLPPLDPVGGGSPCDPIFNIYKRFFDSLKAKPLRRAAHFNFTLIYIKVRCPKRRRTFCIMNDEKGIVLNIM